MKFFVSGLALLAAVLLTVSLAPLMAAPAPLAAAPAAAPAAAQDWQVKATLIEACSCPMFCQCFFNSTPAGHGEMHTGHGGAAGHYCKFNIAYHIDSGSYGNVKLDGAKFWIGGDLGGDLAGGVMDWAVMTFDRAVSAAQRDALQAIASRIYPVQWKSMTSAEGDISWTAGGGQAHALLDGGKTAEIKLTSKVNRDSSSAPATIRNLKYWGAASNDGIVLMPNEVEAYRAGDKAFEYRGTTGFMVTLHADSKTAPPAPAPAAAAAPAK